MKRFFFVALFVVALLAVSVYRAKEGAQESEEQIRQLEAQIALEREEVRALRAEEAHLSRPERIGPLAQEKLGMFPVKPEQMKQEADLNQRLDTVDTPAGEGAQ